MALVPKKILSKFMLEHLLKLPNGTIPLKETVLLQLDSISAVTSARDLGVAWNETQKKAAKQYPDKFILDDRNILHWNDGTIKVLDKKITLTNFRKLNELADAEGVNVNKIVTKLISFIRRGRNRFLLIVHKFNKIFKNT